MARNFDGDIEPIDFDKQYANIRLRKTIKKRLAALCPKDLTYQSFIAILMDCYEDKEAAAAAKPKVKTKSKLDKS